MSDLPTTPDNLAPDIVELLAETVRRGASDLHLTVEAPPMIRLDGGLVPIGAQPLGVENCRDIILGLLTEAQRSRLEENWELDFAVQIQEVGRFRGNAHYTRGALEAALRFIPSKVPALEELGHQDIVLQLCNRVSGLVLVTGTTGSGKSTTLAAMIKYISERRSGVIVTVEDPVEFIFHNTKSIIKQREVGSDTHSFASALKYSMRQDPDVVLVGEMRDPETIAAAITAAETGHLVLGSLHTSNAPGAITRIVDAFPPEQQSQIVAQLANSLEAIISQKLLPLESGKGRALVTEVMVANTAIRAVLRERRWEQLVGLIEIGSKDGMHTSDEALAALYLDRRISKEEAVLNARDKERFETMMRDGPAKKRGIFG